MTANREIHLKSHVAAEPAESDFALAETALPDLGEGQVLVRNTWMSVDPYMRGRMRADSHPAPAYALGEVLDGPAVGEVVASRSEAVPVGASVFHFKGWREHAVLDAAEAVVVDTGLAPQEAYLGPLGTTGLTAYATLTKVVPVREGDTVFVSAAAGAVGSIAGQLARRLGAARVIGSAGGPEKAKKLVEEFGFDAGIDYRAGSLPEALREAAPEGIDLYFDNVGGDHLEAGIGALREGGRVAMVGAVSGYNRATPAPGPANLFHLASVNGSLHGMRVDSYFHLHGEWIATAAPWLADGTLRAAATVVEGLELAPRAFIDLLRGANTGKMLVKL
ncbi:NADP-dependent oxidoreductase [Glycomyces albidus]|jgi:hypothetical protein|uniref:Zinc-binding dehydrogenase n=1 Tax=Glycomyces albidus TaxID=2656774 RepID=A0A6L5GDB7_9ACTN|nr:NADP-dependent oxidoreductase [Glycomyces albidus]MQM27556.1 zinc-binding dehydrogenase [Glycomyces albidus]